MCGCRVELCFYLPFCGSPLIETSLLTEAQQVYLPETAIHSQIRGRTICAVRMKVTIKEWNAVATWRWDMPEDEVCGICRVQFDGTCPTCKYPGDDCSLCGLLMPTRACNSG